LLSARADRCAMREKISAMVDTPVVEELERRAKEQDRSVSAVIRIALAAHVGLSAADENGAESRHQTKDGEAAAAA
jgi:hypothetical protein